tara:strand:+ start:1150 stop:2259 length:1110 start_codon:yes stop_codon:yes gene_type:complete
MQSSNKKYDYVIVGAGFFGAVFANEMKKKGKKCLVLDKRHHIGGNCYTRKVHDINVHVYGPHIFHTSNQKIWEYVNKLVEFRQFVYSPLAKYGDEYYSLPFNMWTFNQLWGVKTPFEAKKKIAETIVPCDNPKNLEEFALSILGTDVYEKLICHYTEKHWQRHPRDLPAFLIKRLPFRLTYDANYYNDKYCGIPIGGYTAIFEKLLENIEVRLNVDFLAHRAYYESIGTKIVFTGKLDELFGYKYGDLDYRSLSFKHDIYDYENHQGVVAINHTSKDVPYTRTIEHKYFEGVKTEKTVVTTETPVKHTRYTTPYYPVNNKENNEKFKKYLTEAKQLDNYIFGGRLADYKYYDMHQVIGSALSKAKKENK